MRKGMIAALVALSLSLSLGVALVAQTSLTDIQGHDREADINRAVANEWFEGYDDNTFRPDNPVLDRHIATVVKRALGSNRTRAEFATFMRGGFDALYGEGVVIVRPSTTGTTSPVVTTSTTVVSTANYYAKTYWPVTNSMGCSGLWDYMTGSSFDWDYGESPTDYTPPEGGYFDRQEVEFVEGWYKRFVTPTAFACEGTAILDNADEVSISITRYLDKAEDPSSGRGRSWYYYSFPVNTTLTCTAAKRAGWELAEYNRAFKYQSKRDGDSDRIMCEGVLKDTGRVNTGDAAKGKVAL